MASCIESSFMLLCGRGIETCEWELQMKMHQGWWSLNGMRGPNELFTTFVVVGTFDIIMDWADFWRCHKHYCEEFIVNIEH